MNSEENNDLHWLDKYLKQAGETSSGDFTRPDDETIFDYLTGTATEKQREEMVEALSNSEEFRQEILEMSQDLDALTDEEINQNILSKKNDNIPDYSIHFNSNEVESPPHVYDIKGDGTATTVAHEKEPINIFDIKYILTTVAVAVIVLFIVIPLIQDPSLRLISETVEPEVLISLETRDAGSGIDEKNYKTELEAAYAGFNEMLLVDDNYKIHLNPLYSYDSLQARQVLPIIKFLDENETLTYEFKSILLKEQYKLKNNSKIWVLTFPSRRLMNMDIDEYEITLDWKNSYEKSGCIVITYSEDGKYKYDPVSVFNFNLPSK